MSDARKKEIGGYLELERFRGFLPHRGALRLSCGRACLEYLIVARSIRTIWLPDFLCDSVARLCEKREVSVRRYTIGHDFFPQWDFEVGEAEWLYLVDYYGQLTDDVVVYADQHSGGRLIVDEAQNFFAAPYAGVDTLYTARKFFGVSDGGFLVSNARIEGDLPRCESFDHMQHVLGRMERTASEFYTLSKQNDRRFAEEPMAYMSLVSENILRATDFDYAKEARSANYAFLARTLDAVNPLQLQAPEAPFAYPLLVSDGPSTRKRLAARGVYVPMLWPNVVEEAPRSSIAYEYARNILPLPVDQRYGEAEMREVLQALHEEGDIPLDLVGKKIAILGGTQITCEIVRAAQALGMHTTVIDYNEPEDSPAKKIADAHALISVADTQAVASYARENGIDGITTGYADSILGWYADICEAADLPCYGTRRQFEIFTDKRAWKALCRQFGVPTARCYGSDVLSLSEDEVAFPVFVKPSDGSGARGTGVAYNFEELREAWNAAKSFSKNGDVLVEEALSGPEVTVFWLFIDGEYHVSMLGNRHVKHNQEGVIPLPAGYTFPASVLPRYLDEVAPNVCRMLESVGVRDGMMFMQCIVRDGVPFVYDIGYRLTGSLEHRLTKQTAGFSAMDMLLHHAVTGRMTDDAHIAEKIERGLRSPCFNISCLIKPGKIDHFEGFEAVEADFRVVGYVKAHMEGETLPPEAKGQLRQIALRILGVVENAEELRDAALDVQALVRIVSDEGDDLMLTGLEPADFSNCILGVVDD